MYHHQNTKDEQAYVDENPDADMEDVDIGEGCPLDLVEGAKVCKPELWNQFGTRKNGSRSESSKRYHLHPIRKIIRIYSYNFQLT